MNFLSKIVCAVAVFATSACIVEPETSKVKEFEFSSDICASIQNATDTRWNAASRTTKAEYHANLLATERQIIDYELPRYRQRLSDMRSNAGPANGPTSQEVPLSNAAPKTVADDPAKAVPPVSPTEGDTRVDTTPPPVASSTTAGDEIAGLGLQGASAVSATSTALQACPGCSEQEVQNKLAILEQNKSKIGTCQFRDSSAPAQTAAGAGPDAGLTEQQKADRENSVNQIRDLVLGATYAKGLCEWWGTVAGGTGANRDRCQRDTINGFCQAALKSAGAVTTEVSSTSQVMPRLSLRSRKPFRKRLRPRSSVVFSNWRMTR